MHPLEQQIQEFLEDFGFSPEDINDEIKLIGDNASIKSRDLVEILLIIEDFLEEEHDIEFDWASSNAMSNANSNYRTLGTLKNYIRKIIDSE